jgi:hypothetical protein
MITPVQCFARFGLPESEKGMAMWDVPAALEIGTLPNQLYCNKLMIEPLTRAFGSIIKLGLLDQVKTWDGCFNIRKMKGSKTSPSLHSWGVAIDINAAWNGYNKPTTMSKELVRCFKDAGFDWGGDWKKKDGMHFQLVNI